MKEEIWKDIEGYEGLYQVSSMGRIKAMAKSYISGNGAVRNRDEAMMALVKNKKNYLVFKLTHNGKSKTVAVHIIVAKHFIPNPLNKPQVNHKFGDKNDNSVSSLEWVTCKENIRHAWSNNLNTAMKGENNANALFTNRQVRHIRKVYDSSKYTQTELASRYGVDKCTINSIVKRRSYKSVK